MQKTRRLFENGLRQKTERNTGALIHIPRGIGMLNLSLIRITVILLLLLFFPISCSETDDVSLIRELIKKAAKLAEDHNVKGLIKLTAEDFHALPGQHDRQGTRKILWWAFRQYGQFNILYPEPNIDPVETPRTATASVYFMIVRKDRSYPGLKELYNNPEAWLEEVGTNADLYRLHLDLEKKDGDWIVKIARLEPFKGLGFGP